MPRPERELDALDGPVRRFAQELRDLRQSAGNPGYRELARRSGYSSSTLSDAAGGRRLPALRVVLEYVKACGADPAPWSERWEAVARELAGATGADKPPYLGLSSFQVQDSDRFFGREKLVGELLRRLADGRFLAVFGASGSGKSSLLRAGLGASFARTGIAGRSGPLVVFTPGRAPVSELERHLTDPQPRLVVVDQFEEIFTLCADPAERRRFVDRLLAETTAPDQETRVVLGLRADFYAACAQFPTLVAAMAERTVLIARMTDAELRRAVTEPAALAGLSVERALVTKVLSEADGQPGALPLVSHALLETWRHRQGSMLTLAGYEAIGGVHGAITRTAEGVYGRLEPGQQRVTRQILVRLTALGQGTADTRRVALRTELDLDGAGPIIDELLRARLVVARDDKVEVAHEALIEAWPRLRGWLTEDRDSLRTHRQIIESAALWQSLNRDEGALLRGTRLALAREWAHGDNAAGRRDELNLVEREFLDASVRVELAEQAAAGRLARQLKALTGALAALLVLAVGGGVMATAQWRTAAAQRQQAISRQFASQSLAAARHDVPKAMRLAAEAYRAAPTVEARGAVLSLASRQEYTGRLEHAGMVKDVAFTRDGATLATAGADGRIVLWNVLSRSERAVLTGHGAAVRSIALTPDDRFLVSGSLNGSVIIWDLLRGGPPRRLRDKGGLINSVAVSPDGSTVAALGEQRRIMLWRVSDGSSLGELTGHGGEFAAVTFSQDGRVLASAGDDGAAVLWDLGSRTRIRTLAVGTAALHAVAFSPDGHTIATAGADRDVTLWDVATGKRLHTLRSHTSSVSAVVFTPDGKTLLSAGYDEELKLWDVSRGTRVASLLGHTSALYGVAVSRDGRIIASGSRDRTALLWDRPRLPMAGHVDEVNTVRTTPDGRTVISAGKDATVVVWDPATATPRATRDIKAAKSTMIEAMSVSPDGRLLALASSDHKVRIINAGTAQVLHTLTGHAGSVMSVAFHPNGRLLATGGFDSTVRIWDVDSGSEVTTLKHEAPVRFVAFSTDGRTLVSTAQNGAIDLREVAGWRLRAQMRDRAGATEAAINHNAGLVAIGRADGTVALWDTAGRNIVGELRGHTGPVEALAFSPDGRLLASGGLDATTLLWNLADRRSWATLTGSKGAVKDLTWSPDSRTLYTAGGDRLVTRWTVEPADAFARICHDLAQDFPHHNRPRC